MKVHTNYGITIDGTASYTADVSRILNAINGSRVGALLLNSLRYHKKPITIAAFTDAGCNATAGGTNLTRSEVKFSPGIFRTPHGPCAKRFGGRGFLPNEVLFHELVHSLRIVSGQDPGAAVATTAGTIMHHFTDDEEFHAVLVTNIYISDPTNKNKSGLRAAHNGPQALGHPFAQPFGMFARGYQVLNLVQSLLNTSRGFAGGLAKMRDIPFNPLAEYTSDPARAVASAMRPFTPQGMSDILVELVKIELAR